MRLLIITGLYPTKENHAGGIFITRRLLELKKHGLDFDVISLYYSESKILQFFKRLFRKPLEEELETIEYKGIRYDFVPVMIGIFDRLFLNRRLGPLSCRAVENKYDLAQYGLIHAHWVYPHGYVASLISRKYQIPLIISAHGSDIHSNPVRFPKTRPYILKSLKYAAKVIFVSKKLREQAGQLGYNADNYCIIPNGVEGALFCPLARREAYKMIALPEIKTRVIGFVGALDQVKRVDMLPEFFREIKTLLGEAAFIVVGDGELKEYLLETCRKYKLVMHHAGRVEPHLVPYWMNIFDVLILPSRQEGFPNVVVEAQACGCPVVGSNVGGMPEAVGDGGLVVEEGENFAQDFARAVVEMIEKPPEKEKLRERALHFDWKTIVNREVEIYREVFKKQEEVEFFDSYDGG